MCLRILSIASVLVAALFGQDAYPPSKPLLRIETGMHTAAIRRIDTDSAGRFAVTASDDKTARVWDLKTGDLLTTLRPPQGEGDEGRLYAVAISPDGQTVALGGYAGIPRGPFSIYLFDRASATLSRRIGGLPEVVHHLAYSPDGRFLVAALGGKNGIRVFDAADGHQVASDADYADDSYWAEFDRNNRIVTASLDGFVRLYDATFRLNSKRRAPGGKHPICARFSPDGSRVAVGFDESTAVNILSGTDLSFVVAPDTRAANNRDLSSVAWSSDGRMFYASGGYSDSGQRPIFVWSDAGRGAATIWPGPVNTVMDLRTLPNGDVLAGAYDPFLGLIDRNGRWVWRKTADIVDHRDNQDELLLSGDGTTVDFGFNTVDSTGEFKRQTARFSITDRSLTLDPASNRNLKAPRTDGLKIEGAINSHKPTLQGRALTIDQYEMSRSFAISTTADTFVLGTEFWLRMFDRQGKEQWHVPVPVVAWDVNLTSDGRYAIAAFGDGTIRWYAASNGEEVLALFVHRDGKRWVVWTPEGFFDSSPGGESLVGYHLNHGPEQAGDFIKVDQVFDLFYRSDLVSQRLKPGGAEAVRAAREKIGDVATILAGGLPPTLELLSPANSQTSGAFELQFRAKNQGGGVGRVVYRVDGIEIEGRPVAPKLPGQDTLNRRFDLSPGRHEVTAAVYNGKNQLAARSISAIVNVTQSERQPTLYVLAAGITNYRDHSLNDGVKFAASDARDLTALLQQQTQGLYSATAPYLLVDSQATRENIGKAIGEIAAKIQPSDVFVMYLAGHGTAIQGDYYFVPWGVTYTSENALMHQSLDTEAIRKLLASIPAKKTLLLLDTCGSGAIAGSRGPGDKAAIGKLSRISGRAILAASETEQMALEGYGGHGVFTFALLEALAKAPMNERGEIEVSRLADYVIERVPSITEEHWHYEQFPVWEFTGQTFPIARQTAPR
jgi:WD40 repeat protein